LYTLHLTDHLGLLIEQFLDENRSQLTHYGILQLNQTMRDNQLAVFFRNNHFSTIWKIQVNKIDFDLNHFL
jgi:hypothetical protein